MILLTIYEFCITFQVIRGFGGFGYNYEVDRVNFVKGVGILDKNFRFRRGRFVATLTGLKNTYIRDSVLGSFPIMEIIFERFKIDEDKAEILGYIEVGNSKKPTVWKGKGSVENNRLSFDVYTLLKPYHLGLKDTNWVQMEIKTTFYMKKL